MDLRNGEYFVSPKPEFDSVFFAQLLSSLNIVHYLEEHATGTTMKNLNEDTVQHISIPFITAEIHEKITININGKMSVCESIEKPLTSPCSRQNPCGKAY